MLNGVKQGGIIGPIVFCVYIDDLLLSLKTSSVGYYTWVIFYALQHICYSA